ncbi:MAG: DUF4129 domain-containing protein [Silvibacterium sp.]|nr:DUF4129 domain-containing protein [Silvibacterium sp.]
MSRYQRYLVAFLLATLPVPALAKESSLAEYTAHLESMRALVQRCEASAAACDPGQVGDDDQVNLAGLGAGANVNQFEVRYDWLRKALKAASDPQAKDREGNLTAAAVRLESAWRGAGARPEGGQFAEARMKADAILRHPEFVTVVEQSVWQKIVAKFFLWLDSLFTHVASFGRRSPWIGPLLEWGLISLALVGLILWAMRALQRQGLAVRAEASRQIEPWEEASRNWRNLAEEQAAQQEWREAIHCLYWASIVMLEGRRFWSPSRSRTPREYVSLLEPGSQRWNLLRQQTRGFERIWYGLNPADANDYLSALDLHEKLRVA